MSPSTAAARPGTPLVAGLLDPHLWTTDPYPLLAQLRQEAPVAWHAERGFWSVARHADVVAVETDPATWSSARGILVDEIGTVYDSPPTMMHCDAPRHTRYRRLAQPAFKPSVVRALEAPIRSSVRSLLDAVPMGEPVDVVSALAVPLPIIVICGILGVDEADWPRVYEWSEAIIPGATDWPQERRDALMAEMIDALLRSTRQRREAPRVDVLSELASAEIDGDRLNDDELAMLLVQLLVAGNETTRNAISGGVLALAETPEAWRHLQIDSAAVSSAVEETLRWTTPVVSFMRTATCDTRIGDQEILAGEHALMLFASANRDEAVFGPTADRFDVTRDPNPHLAFGFGSHFCLGAALARLEVAVVFEELAARYGSVSPAGALERTPSSVIAGIRRAPVVFRAA